MLHAKVLRCPHPHARVKQIDISRAAALAGVRAILTRDTYPAHILSGNAAPLHGFLIKDQPIVAVDRCRYAEREREREREREGDIVAAVAADNEAIAVLHAINVDYEFSDNRRGLSTGESSDSSRRAGRPSTALRARRSLRAIGHGRTSVSNFTISAATEMCFRPAITSLKMNLAFHTSISNRLFLSRRRRATGFEPPLWTSTQMPFPLRGQLSQLLKIPEHCISIRVPSVGGAFGAKSGIRTEAIAVLLSMMSARPVRLCYAMEEDFLTASQHAAIVRLKTGVMADGTLIARASEILLDAGAYADVSPLVAEGGLPRTRSVPLQAPGFPLLVRHDQHDARRCISRFRRHTGDVGGVGEPN